MIILAADVGGTKSNLGIFESGGAAGGEGAAPHLRFERSYATHDFPQSPAALLLRFLQEASVSARDVAAACVGIAGPVEDGVSVAEWLPWHVVDEREVSAGVGVRGTRLINDMVATAWGVTALRPDQLVTLHPGEPKSGRNIAVIAAGTGLGETALVYDDGRYHAVACEGGHTDWAPRNREELDLFKFLLDRSRRVTNEHVICGRGLVNVYTYFKGLETGQFPAALPDSDRDAGRIARDAAAKPDSAEAKTMSLFTAAYGGRAGNLAMQFMATGGVYVGGGIAPKNLDRLRDGTFVAHFLDKGPLFRPILEKIPVHVVLEQKTALIGAAQYALAHPSAA
jgi:glucokinase